MSYRIHKKESVQRGVARVVREHVDDAIEASGRRRNWAKPSTRAQGLQADPKVLERLAVLIERRQAELRTHAARIGALVFAERPKAFADRIEEYWRTWRGEPKANEVIALSEARPDPA